METRLQDRLACWEARLALSPGLGSRPGFLFNRAFVWWPPLSPSLCRYHPVPRQLKPSPGVTRMLGHIPGPGPAQCQATRGLEVLGRGPGEAGHVASQGLRLRAGGTSCAHAAPGSAVSSLPGSVAKPCSRLSTYMNTDPKTSQAFTQGHAWPGTCLPSRRWHRPLPLLHCSSDPLTACCPQPCQNHLHPRTFAPAFLC